MFLKSLYLKDFRIFNERRFSFSPTCNIFYGFNGVGKTSLLEAIGYMGRGKSFRTAQSKKLILSGKKCCMISGELEKMQCLHRIGVEIQQTNNRRLQLNGQPARGVASLAALMPLIWINPFNLHLFLATPALRRQFMDWGVFHHFKEFYITWQTFNKALQQRNMALRKQLSDPQICCFDNDLAESGIALDQMRKKYVNELRPIIFTCFDDFIKLPCSELRYERGWPDGVDFSDLLKKTLSSDRRVGYTQIGPHRMDIKLLVDMKTAQDFCSQGQHKLISYVFYMAQGQLFGRVHSYPPLFLIDDLPSELDHHKVAAVATMLSQLRSQVFVSGIAEEDFKGFCQIYDSELFHVKHTA